MEFAILGPLQVSDAREIVVGAAKPRSLLLRLVLDANRSVAAERLTEDLWEGAPPPSAGPTLQGYVSQLRKALGADRLLTQGGGYQLVVGPDELDAVVFESAVTDARRLLDDERTAPAVERLQLGLGLWRGPALVDAAGAAWSIPTIGRLEETRLGAIEMMLEARLALGDLTRVIADAEVAITEHPLRERLWSQLMTALYRDGRQAEALRAFQRLRTLLGDELGIEPSRELADLEAAMVRQEPTLTRSPPSVDRAVASSIDTLTFLFTDLEGSTRMWEEHGREMPDALARHDRMLRDAVERHGGRVIKTTGDGTIAAFNDATAAVRAASDAQRMLAAEPWGATGPLRARIAIHTGTAESRDGDYFGPTLNRAARMTAISHGGQVLVSQSTEAMVRDTAEIEVIDLGEHRMRDLTRPERVFQVVVPGQPADFPPLRSLDVLPTNLPVQLTTFIGRVKELQRVRELLDEHRAVTITGVGGVGKTRIAMQVAGEIVGDYADGAWCCELAATTDPESMLAAITSTLHISFRSGMTVEESIVEFFRSKDLLWVLDNCEHLLGPVAQLVDQVLRASPGVRVLATSREALDVDGERTMPLRSMTLEAPDTGDAAPSGDAVLLFVERASTARADFELDDSNSASITTICRRIDGIPLAIELAAVRVVSMSPPEISAHLDERFRLLTGGRRVALERHQTLRAAVDWSYAMLDERERVVFERLAVFAGSFDARAAQAVVTDDVLATWDVIDALDGLVRKSLVVAETQPDGGTRYQMLETLRQYARDRLDEGGGTEAWRRRHAVHYGALLDEIERGILGRDEFVWRARREPELDNLRAAISWAIDSEEPALVIALLSAASEEAMVLWDMMGRPATRALHLIDRFEPVEQIELLNLASLEAWLSGEIQQVIELSERAEALAAPLEVAQIAQINAFLRQSYGRDFSDSAARRRAIATLRDSPEVVEQSGLQVALQSRTYSSLGGYLVQGTHDRDLELAARLIERAHQLALESQNPSSLGAARFAYAQLTAGVDPDAALAALDECVALHAQGANLTSKGGALYISALLLADRGERPLAIRRLREAIAYLAPLGRNMELDGAFGYSIETLIRLDELDVATVLIGAILAGALENLREMSLPPDRVAPDVRGIRETIGLERFNTRVAEGSNMSYDELTRWLLETLDILAAAEGD